MTDPNLVEIDGKFYKEAQHITTGDHKLFNSGYGPEAWTVTDPAEVHGKCVGVDFRHADGGAGEPGRAQAYLALHAPTYVGKHPTYFH